MNARPVFLLIAFLFVASSTARAVSIGPNVVLITDIGNSQFRFTQNFTFTEIDVLSSSIVLGTFIVDFHSVTGVLFSNLSVVNPATLLVGTSALVWDSNASLGSLAYYNVTGLLPSSIYEFKKDSVLLQTITADENGFLSASNSQNGTFSFVLKTLAISTADIVILVLFVFVMLLTLILGYKIRLFMFVSAIIGFFLALHVLAVTGSLILTTIIAGISFLLLVVGIARLTGSDSFR